MADYYFQNLCQPELDIAGWLKSQPPVITDGKSVIVSDYVGNQITYSSTDLNTGVTVTSNQPAAFAGCVPGTQAMSVTGISNDQKTELAWSVALILIVAWSIKSIKYTL